MVQRRTPPSALTAVWLRAPCPIGASASTDTLTVDFGATPGAFHGGAGGSPYGVHGAGVPSDAVLAGFHPKTLSTKAQDGPKHAAPMNT